MRIRPDQCPACGSLERHVALKEDGSVYNPFAENAKLPRKFRCVECGHIWPFQFIHLRETA